jgi:SAM-dependent methyltransferase
MVQSNQKEVLFRELRRCISKQKPGSILDVGAGQVHLAERLSKLASVYTAVEQDKERAVLLHRAGIHVIHRRFPFEVGRRFDVVIASHSLPNAGGDILSCFLAGLCKNAKEDGHLSIITFKGGQGWIPTARRDIFNQLDNGEHELGLITEFFMSRGTVSIDRFSSEFMFVRKSEAIEFLRPWMTGLTHSWDEHKSKLEEVVIDTRSESRGFVIPVEHVLISCHLVR